jgi:hypothetical protein
MKIRVTVSDIKIVNARLIGDLSYLEYGIYVVDYEFTDGDVVEEDEIEAWIYMDEDKLFDIGNVY